MKVRLLGISTCDSCRKAKRWLESSQISFEWVDLRETSPSRQEIATWIEKLGSKAMRNTSGASYRALGDEKKAWGDTEWQKAFARDPMLLKRPILEVNDVAKAVGFRAETYASLF